MDKLLGVLRVRLLAFDTALTDKGGDVCRRKDLGTSVSIRDSTNHTYSNALVTNDCCTRRRGEKGLDQVHRGDTLVGLNVAIVTYTRLNKLVDCRKGLTNKGRIVLNNIVRAEEFQGDRVVEILQKSDNVIRRGFTLTSLLNILAMTLSRPNVKLGDRL